MRLSLHFNNWQMDKNFYLVIRNNTFLLSTLSCSWILAPKVTCFLKRIRNFFYMLGFCFQFCAFQQQISRVEKDFEWEIGSCVYALQLETAHTITIWNAKLPAGVPLANRYRLVLRVKEPSFLQVQSTSPPKFSVTTKKLSLSILIPRKIIPMDSSKVRDHKCLLEKYILTSDFS